jgi:myo-inositol 2-dehydrogenase/D-chiro-inositol 1-dehydrogenase
LHETTVILYCYYVITADPVQNFFLERYAAAYRNEVESFIDAVVDGKKPSPDGNDGLRAQMLADAATESWQSGKPVKVGL